MILSTNEWSFLVFKIIVRISFIFGSTDVTWLDSSDNVCQLSNRIVDIRSKKLCNNFFKIN